MRLLAQYSFRPSHPGGSDGKESACKARNPSFILGWGRILPLEKGMATHSSILAWGIPQTEEPGSYSPWGRKDSKMTEELTLSLSLYWYRHSFSRHSFFLI